MLTNAADVVAPVDCLLVFKSNFRATNSTILLLLSVLVAAVKAKKLCNRGRETERPNKNHNKNNYGDLSALGVSHNSRKNLHELRYIHTYSHTTFARALQRTVIAK